MLHKLALPACNEARGTLPHSRQAGRSDCQHDSSLMHCHAMLAEWHAMPCHGPVGSCWLGTSYTNSPHLCTGLPAWLLTTRCHAISLMVFPGGW